MSKLLEQLHNSLENNQDQANKIFKEIVAKDIIAAIKTVEEYSIDDLDTYTIVSNMESMNFTDIIALDLI